MYVTVMNIKKLHIFSYRHISELYFFVSVCVCVCVEDACSKFDNLVFTTNLQ